jgi:serine/threonine-protein phosphatase PGAM5
MAERILYLIRHAAYENEKGIKGRLTEFGRQQAQATAAALADLPVTSIICSTWARAEETAHIIADYHPHLEVQRARALIELPPLYAVTHPLGEATAPEDIPEDAQLVTSTRPDLEGLAEVNGSGDDLHFMTEPVWAEYLDRKRGSLSLAERIQKEIDRADRAYERFFKATRGDDKHELIIAHGTLIRYFVTKVLSAPPQVWARMACANCGITKVAIVPRWEAGTTQVYLESFMDVGHLPYHLRS